MGIARPTSLDGALAALGEHPQAVVLAGGTDVMVDVNFGRRRPRHVVALRRVEELSAHGIDDRWVELGAGVTYGRIEAELADELPALAAASRTVGSPQIRNAGTIGGNLGTASPAGDALPYLFAVDAEVVVAGPEGERALAIDDFVTGPKRTALGPGEVIRCVRFPRVRGPQEFCKIGTRNAMVISVAALALVCDVDARRVRAAMGAVAPRPLRPRVAEDLASEAIDWDAMTIPAEALEGFGAACAEAASPIDDHRSTSAYRRHGIGVLARRALRRSLAR